MNSMHKLESGAVAVEHARPSSALDTLDFNSTGYISEMLLGTCEVLNYQLRLTLDLKKKKKKTFLDEWFVYLNRVVSSCRHIYLKQYSSYHKTRICRRDNATNQKCFLW